MSSDKELIKLQELKVLGDDRGALVALESMRSVAFDFQRVYYIFATQPGVRRGLHAHKTLKQFVVCVAGSCRFLMDDGVRREEVMLASPSLGLYVDPMVWHEMFEFSADCVLMVLADQPYDEADYIRDYEAFLEAAKK